ncbi:MAG: cbb3-type cytochrome c oxidase subunit I [Chloroflexi bacterium]|nr:cbb3-type cytochrome c oxidase subunit I [Chloroflexota bacterium]
MSKTTLGFIFSGMVYLAIGTVLGVLFLAVPDSLPLRTVHVHLNLVGFVMFLIFGVAYHILPRFRGRPLHSEKLAWAQLWMANVGLVGMMLFIGIGAYSASAMLTPFKAAFGALLGLSIYTYIYNMWRTLA